MRIARWKGTLREIPSRFASRSAALKSKSGIEIAVFTMASITNVIPASSVY